MIKIAERGLGVSLGTRGGSLVHVLEIRIARRDLGPDLVTDVVNHGPGIVGAVGVVAMTVVGEVEVKNIDVPDLGAKRQKQNCL